MTERINYLEIHSDVPETIKLYWTETFQIRQNLLKIENVTVDDYLERFKPLREQLGQELVKLLIIYLFKPLSY